MNEENIQAPVETPGASQYITSDQLMEYGRQLVEQFGLAQAPKSEPTNESPQSIAREAARATASQMMEMQRPGLVAQILGEVAKDFGPEVEKELEAELMSLPTSELMGTMRSAKAKQHLSRLARGIYAERQAAPNSSPSGTVRGASAKENELTEYFMNAYHDVPGFTEKMAREMAKERV